MMRVFSLAYVLFLICTVCVILRGYIYSLPFWLGFLVMKSLIYSIIILDFLEALACSRHNMRAIPGFLFWQKNNGFKLNYLRQSWVYWYKWHYKPNIKISRYWILCFEIKNHFPTIKYWQDEKSVELYTVTNTNWK